jgi:4-diphosphocytidyl-2-C-methyl-D-erythritol kinase
MRIDEAAPAKINLALHVTGRRADGYHLLDSLVAFAGPGDCLRAEPAAALTLAVTGPGAAGVPTGADNLVLRAARLFDDPPGGAALTLEKHLPAAGGIGGGSSDAAATLRALARLWDRPLPGPAAVLSLGADVPVCLAPGAWRMRGIGDRLDPGPALPACWAVLVNPGLAVSTPSVFAALQSRENPPLPDLPPRFANAAEMAAWLRATRNDLATPAQLHAPAIGDVLAALGATPGVLLARMSGSGATCFGLYSEASRARLAAASIAGARPGWWVMAAELIGGAAAAGSG